MLEINGSVAVITGGSGGIGMALAQYWLDRGGKAVIADIDEAAEVGQRSPYLDETEDGGQRDQPQRQGEEGRIIPALLNGNPSD